MFERCFQMTKIAISVTRMHCGRSSAPRVPRIGNQIATARNAEETQLPSEMKCEQAKTTAKSRNAASTMQ